MVGMWGYGDGGHRGQTWGWGTKDHRDRACGIVGMGAEKGHGDRAWGCGDSRGDVGMGRVGYWGWGTWGHRGWAMGLWGWEHECVGWGTEGRRDRTGGIVGTAVGSGAQNGTAGTGCGIGPRGRGGLGCGDGMWSNGADAEGCGAVIRSCGDGGSGQTMGAADNGVGVAGMWGGADGGGTACGPPRGRSGGRAMGHGPQGVGTPISPPPHIPSPPAAARSFAPSIPGRSPPPRPIRAAAGDGRGDAEGHREPSGSAPVGVGDGERSAFLGCPLRNPLSTGRRGSDVLRVRTGREGLRGASRGAAPGTAPSAPGAAARGGDGGDRRGR